MCTKMNSLASLFVDITILPLVSFLFSTYLLPFAKNSMRLASLFVDKNV